MVRRKSILSLQLLLLFISIGATVSGIDMETAPGWLIFEKGKQMFDSADYGESLFYFRQARDKLGNDAGVDFWIGRVFEAEGQYDLAKKQYQTALEKAGLLEVREEAYEIHYRLAQIHFTSGDFNSYESELMAIIDRDNDMRIAEAAVLFERRLLSRTLAEKGIDKLLELYRLKDHGGLPAYYQLGVYKLRTGLIESATEYLTYSLVITFSTIIDYLIKLDPEFRYSSFTSLMEDTDVDRAVIDYIEKYDAFGQLYALAAALRDSGEGPKQDLAVQLFRFVRDYDEQGYWSGRARAQIITPFEEDFMIVF